MGYNTYFFGGKLKLNSNLDKETHNYLFAFSQSRRVTRIFNKDQCDIDLGIDGEFYVPDIHEGELAHFIVDEKRNTPPSTQPGLWCDWRPSPCGNFIEHNGAEKSYNAVEWLKYLISNFLEPRGYVLNGSIKWQGEDSDDTGTIVINNNVVTTHDSLHDVIFLQENLDETG